MKLFADDTSLYVEFDNANSASDALNDDLVKIQQWAADQWLVKFITSKAKVATCTYYNAIKRITLHIPRKLHLSGGHNYMLAIFILK